MRNNRLIQSPWAIRAIRDGRRHQARKLVQPQPAENWDSQKDFIAENRPYGTIGDQLWVPEHNTQNLAGRLAKHAALVPQELVSLTLEITDIRIERLQGISEQDAVAEGNGTNPGAKKRFYRRWNAVHPSRATRWQANPWVWVIEFKVICNEVKP